MAQVKDSSCPANAIAVGPGASIQAAVDRAGEGAVFCLKSGIYRAQTVQPRARQRFYGERHTVLNGSRLLVDFRRDGRYWVAANPFPPSRKHGECLPSAPVFQTCRLRWFWRDLAQRACSASRPRPGLGTMHRS